MNAIAINYHWNPEQEAQNWINNLECVDQIDVSTFLCRVIMDNEDPLARSGLLGSLARVFGEYASHVFSLLEDTNYQVHLKIGAADQLQEVNNLITELNRDIEDLQDDIYSIEDDIRCKTREIRNLEQKCETLHLV